MRTFVTQHEGSGSSQPSNRKDQTQRVARKGSTVKGLTANVNGQDSMGTNDVGRIKGYVQLVQRITLSHYDTYRCMGYADKLTCPDANDRVEKGFCRLILTNKRIWTYDIYKANLSDGRATRDLLENLMQAKIRALETDNE
ncbi:hypothetical protein EVAR_62011_1 [Eumeta japonica]|uniref:Uncharacterized protein n=1 Tax=Eumeta variegata TaxID=151549 RepID=A0A4C1ZUD5_EUMVA|nr:hypothetical protein EVAR_62011_1 [Eumeta japonica]